MTRGSVCFVGLGPGDPKLTTPRGTDRIAQGDIVLADGQMPVEQIIDLARSGRRVIRAVRGDPFEAPEAAAEIRAVGRSGVGLEVVPGVGWAGAAAAFAGVVGTAAVAPRDRLVEALLSTGTADRPVTLVANPGMPSQRALATTSAAAADRVDELGADRLVFVWGLPEADLQWFERRPLFGKRVLVTRAREQAGGTAALLRDQGADPIVVPTIVIGPPSDADRVSRAIADLIAGRYDWAAFTSANGVERTWEAIEASGGDARAFGRTKLAAIGPATAEALLRRGLRADVIAKEFRGEGLADGMLSSIGIAAAAQRVLLARAAQARDVLPEALRAAGCEVDVVAVYETHAPPASQIDALAEELARDGLDAVLFTSSSTVDNLCDLLGDRAAPLRRN